MKTVTIRDLRNHGGAVVDLVAGGESVTITRSGTAVAELRPIRPSGIDAATLLKRWRRLPLVDPQALRRDIDDVIDASL